MSLKFKDYNEFMGYINNPANYKKTRKKLYSIWCCMPAKGTKVHNELENADYVTSDENGRFVLSGTMGEQWVIAGNKLAATYTFADGTAITETALKAKRTSDGTIPWFKVTTCKDSEILFACPTPVNMQYTIQTSWAILQGNRPGVKHGKGDFIMARNVNGQPAMDKRWIVNGTVFINTYDNRGFTEYLDMRYAKELGVVPKPLSQLQGASSIEQINKSCALLGNVRDKHYLVLDCSTIENSDLYIDRILNNLHLEETERYKFPYKQKDATFIDYVSFIPSFIRGYMVPILFFVDSINSFKNNAQWKDCRQNYHDIVVDRNAKINFVGNIK